MKYAITGVTGTLGQTVARMLLNDPDNEVIGISRDEQKQRQMRKHPRLRLYLGDVRDAKRLTELTKEVDHLFHFAALKCVDTLENEVEECIKTNVIGTMNVCEAQKANNISRVILSATDKGVYPINAYGNSKALAERIVLQNPNNVICRYGNVIASRGSVILAFMKSLEEEKTVYITCKTMTRFLIPIEDAALFVVGSSREKRGGLKVPYMSSASVLQIADAVAQLLGVRAYKTEIIGIRPGEKMHECLQTRDEGGEINSNTASRFNQDELVDLIRPVVEAL